jgi:hypothetical protein
LYGWLNEPVAVTHRRYGFLLLVAAFPFLVAGLADAVLGSATATGALFGVGAAAAVAGVLVGYPFWLFTMITCQWCLGVWMSAAVTAAATFVVDGVPPYLWALTALAVAAGQSFLHLVEDALSEYVSMMTRQRERGDG